MYEGGIGLRKSKKEEATEAAAMILDGIRCGYGIPMDVTFEFVNEHEKYKGLWNDDGALVKLLHDGSIIDLIDSIVEQINEKLNIPKTDIHKVKEPSCFEHQTEVVVRGLMNELIISRDMALKLWIKSETRKAIQDEYNMEHISGARCYDELMMEMQGDPYWMMGQFD